MRLLAAERVIRATIFSLLAIGVSHVRGSQERLQQSFERELPLIRPLANQIGWNPDNSKLIHTSNRRFHCRRRR